MVVSENSQDVKIVAETIVSRYILRLREDGILHLRVTSGEKWKPEHYELLFPAIGKLIDQEVPLLITYDNFIFPPAEATAAWASSEVIKKYFKSEALLLHSLPLKILGNFYLKYNKPGRPTKVFDKDGPAIEWLKRFL